MTTEIEIVNQALSFLAEGPIMSFDDQRETARVSARNFPLVRDGLLRVHPWNFASHRVFLPPEHRVDTPKTSSCTEWRYAYPLPEDCLRVLRLHFFERRPPLFQVEGRTILANVAPPLPLLYIRRVTQPLMFDALFAEALVAKMAYTLAYQITGKQSFADRAYKLYQQKLNEARAVDGLEGSIERAEDNDLVHERFP